MHVKILPKVAWTLIFWCIPYIISLMVKNITTEFETNFFLIFSAVLAAGAPHMAPFMADECLLAMPDVEGLDYTMREYMRFVDYVKACVERLNSQGKHYCKRSESGLFLTSFCTLTNFRRTFFV